MLALGMDGTDEDAALRACITCTDGLTFDPTLTRRCVIASARHCLSGKHCLLNRGRCSSCLFHCHVLRIISRLNLSSIAVLLRQPSANERFLWQVFCPFCSLVCDANLNRECLINIYKSRRRLRLAGLSSSTVSLGCFAIYAAFIVSVEPIGLSADPVATLKRRVGLNYRTL